MPAKPDEQLPVSRGAREAAAEAIFYAAGGSSWTKAHKPLYRDMADAAVKALGEREPAPSTSEINALKDALAQANAEIAELREEAVPEPAPSTEREAWKDLAMRAIDCLHDVVRETNWGQPTFGPNIWEEYREEQNELLHRALSTPTAQTEAGGLAEELAALVEEVCGSGRVLAPRMQRIVNAMDAAATALSSAPAEFHIGGAAAALAITEPMQSAPADVTRAREDGR